MESSKKVFLSEPLKLANFATLIKKNGNKNDQKTDNENKKSFTNFYSNNRKKVCGIRKDIMDYEIKTTKTDANFLSDNIKITHLSPDKPKTNQQLNIPGLTEDSIYIRTQKSINADKSLTLVKFTKNNKSQPNNINYTGDNQIQKINPTNIDSLVVNFNNMDKKNKEENAGKIQNMVNNYQDKDSFSDKKLNTGRKNDTLLQRNSGRVDKNSKETLSKEKKKNNRDDNQLIKNNFYATTSNSLEENYVKRKNSKSMMGLDDNFASCQTRINMINSIRTNSIPIMQHENIFAVKNNIIYLKKINNFYLKKIGKFRKID